MQKLQASLVTTLFSRTYQFRKLPMILANLLRQQKVSSSFLIENSAIAQANIPITPILHRSFSNSAQENNYYHSLVVEFLKNGIVENIAPLLRAYWENSQPQNLFTSIDKTLMQSPHLLPLMTTIIGILINKENYKEALQYCREMEKIQPKNPLWSVYRGMSLNRLGHYHEALSIINGFLDKSPGTTPLLLEKIIALKGLKEWSKALELTDQLLARNVNESLELTKSCYQHKTKILFELKQYQEMVSNQRKLIELEPDNAINYHDCGVALLNLQQTIEASQCFEQAIKISPTFLKPLYGLDECYRILDNPNQRLETLAKILTIKPDDIEIRKIFINLLITNGIDKEIIEKELKKFHAMQPNDLVTLEFCGLANTDPEKSLPLLLEAIDKGSKEIAVVLKATTLLKARSHFLKARDILEKAINIAPKNPSIIRAYAVILDELGEHKNAKELLENALSISQDDADIQHSYGIVLDKLGNYSAALLALDKSLSLRPNFADSLCSRAIVLMHLGRLPEALVDVEKALEYQPNNVKFTINKVSILKELKQIQEALHLCNTLPSEALDCEMLTLRGSLYHANENNHNALKDIDLAISLNADYAPAWAIRTEIFVDSADYQTALQSIDKVLKLNPDYLRACVLKGIILFNLKEYEGALSCFRKYPDYLENEPLERLRASILTKLGQYSEALPFYQKQYETNPNDFQCIYNYGYVLSMLGKLEEGVIYLKRAHKINPKDEKLNYDLGVAMNRFGNNSDAIEYYNQAIKLDPNVSDALYNRAFTLFREGHYLLAQADIKRAFTLAPHDKDIKRGMEQLTVHSEKMSEAFKKLESNNYHDAEEIFAKIIEQQPTNTMAIFFKGLTNSLSEKYHDAITDISRAINQGIETTILRSHAFTLLGMCYSAIRDYSKSIEAFIHASKLEPHNIKILQSLGEVYVFTNDGKNARHTFEKILSIDTNNIAALLGNSTALVMLLSYDKALDHCNKLLTLEPDNVYGLCNKALALIHLQKFDDALTCLNKAIGIDPRHMPSLVNKVAILLEQFKDYPEVVVVCDQVLKLEPNNLKAIAAKSVALTYLQKFPEALTSIDSALKIDGKRIDLLKHKLEILRLSEKHNDALLCIEEILSIVPRDKAILHAKSRTYLTLVKTETAISVLELIHEYYPDDIETLEILGMLFEKLGNTKAAILHFDKALAINPKDGKILFHKGNLLKSTEYDLALTCYKQAVSLGFKNSKLYLNMGNIYRDCTRFNDALSCYTHAINLAENDKEDRAKAFHNRATIFFLIEKKEDALSDSDQAINLAEMPLTKSMCLSHKVTILIRFYEERLEEALALQEQAILLHSEDASYYDTKIDCLMMLKKWDSVLDFLPVASSKMNLDKKIKLYQKVALNLATYRRYQDALLLTDQCLAMDLHNYRSMMDKAIYLNLAQKDVEALKQCDLVIGSCQNVAGYALIFMVKALVLEKLNHYGQALECYSKAIDLKYNEAYFYMARLLLFIGKFKEALYKIDNAISKSTTDADRAELYYWQGYIQELNKQYDDAMNSYEIAIGIIPHEKFFLLKGNLLFTTGKIHEAIDCYNYGLSNRNNYGPILFAMGDISAHKRNFDLAIKYFSKALDDPDLNKNQRSMILHNRAIAYLNKTYYSEAMADLNHAVSDNPHHIQSYIARGIVASLENNYDKSLIFFGEAITKYEETAQTKLFNIDSEDRSSNLSEDRSIGMTASSLFIFESIFNSFNRRNHSTFLNISYTYYENEVPIISLAHAWKGMALISLKKNDLAIAEFDQALRTAVLKCLDKKPATVLDMLKKALKSQFQRYALPASLNDIYDSAVTILTQSYIDYSLQDAAAVEATKIYTQIPNNNQSVPVTPQILSLQQGKIQNTKNISQNEIKLYFESVNKFVLSIIDHPLLRSEQNFLLALSDKIGEYILSQNPRLNRAAYEFILGHLSRINFTLDLNYRKELNASVLIDHIDEKIQEGQKMLENLFPKHINALSPEDIAGERKLIHEQQTLHNSPEFHQFLNDIKIYAVSRSLKPKKIFISYAWPIADLHHEAWTQSLIRLLALHLNEAGLEVSVDILHSGSGMPLNRFMDGKTEEADHVLVISTRTMEYKYKTNGYKGVCYEYYQAMERWIEERPDRFIIPVCLNKKNHSVGFVRTFVEKSLYDGYRTNIENLLVIIYGFSNHFAEQFPKWQTQKSAFQKPRSISPDKINNSSAPAPISGQTKPINLAEIGQGFFQSSESVHPASTHQLTPKSEELKDGSQQSIKK